MLAPDGVAASLAAAAGAAPAAQRAVRRAGPALLWLLLTVALAGPRIAAPVAALETSGRDLVIALDVSGSMQERDFLLDGAEAQRLDVVRALGAAFARGRAGDRVALILFGSEAYVATPFTFDVEAVATAVERAEIGISGNATNIGDALGLALRRLRGSPAEAKVIVLLSDGKSNAGPARPEDAARLARELGARIHTIAFGPKDLLEAGERARNVVDARALRAIAEISGGRYFRARTTEDFAAVTAEIDALEGSDLDGPAAEIWRELWIWPAGGAVALALALAVVRARDGLEGRAT